MRLSSILPFLFCLSFLPLSHANTDSRLLRFPDIHQEKVAFVYAGDIYLSSIQGGQAQRLTSDDGQELFPKFSPDGQKIAFSAEYSGSRQVFIINTDGSQLQQLTYYNDVGLMAPRGGFDYRVLDWTPDGQYILVRANRLPWGKRMGRPILVPVDGSMPKEMAIPEGGGGMFSPDGNTLVYTPIDREWRTWKRHKGGRAQDVWLYDLQNNTSQQLTDYPGTDHQPLWVGEDIYFVSDREYTLNLYQYQQGHPPIKISTHDKFDVLWPSAGPNSIVYQNGGYLYHYNTTSEKTERLSISIPGDRPGRTPRFIAAQNFIEDFDISHDGQRALFNVRGEIFTAPKKHGPIRNISHSKKAREIHASWSPNGKFIAYASDISGEYEIYIRNQDGKGKSTQLTQNSNTWIFKPKWSPTSDKLAWANKHHRLYVSDLEGKISEIDSSNINEIRNYSFSHDGQYLIYEKSGENALPQIWLYHFKSQKRTQLSNGKTQDFSPVFDPKGRYLYFLSKRDYHLNFSDYEFDYLYHNATRAYAVPLNAQVSIPGKLTSDETQIAPPKKDKKKKDKKKKDKNSLKITLNQASFYSSAIPLMKDSGEFSHLQANDKGVLLIKKEGKKKHLKLITVNNEIKSETISSGVDDYALAAGGKYILAKHGKKYSVIEAKAKQKLDKHLNLSNMQVRVDPRIEWQQMYRDAWRTWRDWFYDANMHGQDWQAIYDKYLPLVDHVAQRSDLDFILSEMAGEMNAGHIYVQRGDEYKTKRIEGGLLGAEISSHPSGNFKIDKIYQGENWHQEFRSPLTEAGANVKTGEFIIAVNGIASTTVSNIYQLLENTADKVTSLTIADNPKGKNAREVLVKPIKRETSLRYLDWIQSRAAYVEELSGGRIGYVHLPNTHTDGNRELYKQLLPQINKEALIIDDRYNGGGFIPDNMIALLAREPLNYWKQRGLKPNATPFYHHQGPKAMLVNGYSSSGGDALPYYFRKLKLGPIIGTRTWGGLIGISGNPKLVDGGMVYAATFRFMDTEGNWAVENEGIEPDIHVIDRPELIYQGKDPSIEKAVETLLKQLPAEPTPSILAPPAPKNF